MENFIVVLLVVLIIVMVIGIVIVLKRSKPVDDQASQNVLNTLTQLRQEITQVQADHRRDVQHHLEKINDQLGQGQRHAHSSMQQQFEQTSKIIKDVTERLGALDNTNKQVLDFSSQLQNLQNILKNPKQRGVLGEYWLETLLQNVLPRESYHMQYQLGTDDKTGKSLIADAVIMVREQIIAIDAKFSLENYNRMTEESDPARREELEKTLKSDVKNRIDETAKYIKPELNTMNFAFMFIPAEGVYYNLLNADVGSGINSRNLIEYAFTKHVMIVSPTSFYAYLQTVLLGLRELQIEERTSEIIKRVGELGKHFGSYADYHDKVGKNLSTVVNQFNLSSGELKKVHKDIIKITDGDVDDLIVIEGIEKPIELT